MTSANQARILLIAATLSWGVYFPLARSLELAMQRTNLLLSIPVLVALSLMFRLVLAALQLAPFYGMQLMTLTRRELSQAFWMGACLSGGLYLQSLGLIWTDASVCAFLTQLYTILIPLIVALRDRRLPTVAVALACLLVLGGIIFLSPNALSHFTFGPGELASIACAFLVAGLIVLVELPGYAQNRAGPVTLLLFVFASVFSVGLVYLTGGSLAVPMPFLAQPEVWVLIFLIVTFCTSLNLLIMNTWQRKISATEAGLIYCLEPVFATISSTFLPGWLSGWFGLNYFNETLSGSFFIGAGLILVATLIITFNPPRPILVTSSDPA